MSIKLTWKDNTTIESRYEVWKIDPSTNDKTLVGTLAGTESKDGIYTWLGTGEYQCGDHTFDVAAVSATEQYAWLPNPITITLPCDENIVVCHRFETNLGNSAPAGPPVHKVYNLTTFTQGEIPSVKEDINSSAYFRGDSVVEYQANQKHFFASPDPTKPDKDFTVEGWFRFAEFDNTLNENGALIFAGMDPADTIANISIEGGVYHTPASPTGDKVAKVYFKAQAGTGMGNRYEYITTNAVIKPLQWTHIAWVKDAENLHIYIDGELEQTFNFKGLFVAPIGTFKPFRIGAGTSHFVSDNPGMGFRGNMVDFRVVNGQAITICPDIFPKSMCIPGQPVDEDKKVTNEYVTLNACTGISTTTGSWLDGSGENPFTFFGGSSAIEVHNGPDDCPCYAKLNTTLRGPSTSTFQNINEFSFATWFKTGKNIKSGASERGLLDYTHQVGFGQNAAKYGFKVVLSSVEGGKNGTLDLVVGTGLDSTWETYSSFKNEWIADRWYHVIVIHHGNLVTMYINGSFHRGVTGVVGINSHSEKAQIGSGSWGGSLSLSTWDFYKNQILNSQEIERSYDPETVIDTTDPCPGDEPCVVDKVYTDFSDWGDFHGTWSGDGWALVSQHDSTHPGWNNSALDGSGSSVNPHIKINTDNSITFDPEFHYASSHNRLYAFSPELHNVKSGAESWCISASIEGSTAPGAEIAVMPVILQDGKMYLAGNLGSSGLKNGGNTITDQYWNPLKEITNVVASPTDGPPNLRKPFQIGIAMSNSLLSTWGTLTKYEVCIKTHGKKCHPPKIEPTDPSCADLKLHLSYDYIDTGLDTIEDSSKYNRKVLSNGSTSTSMDNFTGETKQLYTLDNASVDIDDGFRVTNTDVISVDGWLKIPSGANAYHLVKKVENNWSKTALTPVVYNGHDWYIYVDPSAKYLELAHGEQRHRVDIETDEWFHLACLIDRGFKSIFIDGAELAVEVFDDIPAQIPSPVMVLNGLVDDLRIVKDNALYRDQFFPPHKYTSTACRNETAKQACVRVANDEVFNTWTTQNNGSHSGVEIVKRYNHESVQVKTVSGSINYVGLVREDVVVFDYALQEATSLNLNLNLRMLRLDNSTGSDVYVVIKQNNTWFYYFAGVTGDSSLYSNKEYAIDVANTSFTWVPTFQSGNDTIDLTGSTQTALGFAVSNSDAGQVITEIDNATIEIRGQRCDTILTPDQPICEDVVLHLQSKDHTDNDTTIIDHSPYRQMLTHDSVSHSTDRSKYGSSSLQFEPLSAGVKATNAGQFDFRDSPFTIEFWANLNNNTTPGHFYSLSDGSNGDNFRSYINNDKITVDVGDITLDVPITHTTVGEWHHYAMVATGSELLVFVDGELKGETNYTPPLSVPPGDLYVGSYTKDDEIHSLSGLDGWVDDFRTTIGTAIYNTKFLPPIKLPIYLSEYTVPVDCSTTVLHLQSVNFPAGSNVIVDASGLGNQIVPKFTTHDDKPLFDTSSSFVFAGNSNITAVGGSTTTFDVLSGQDFTIEAWINPTFQGNSVSFSSQDRGWGIITNLDTGSNATGHVLFITTTGKLGYRAQTPLGNLHISSEPNLVTANTWQHVAVTRSNSIITVYLNGRALTGKHFEYKISTIKPMIVSNAYTAGSNGNYQGHLNDVRVIIGHSVYNGCGSTIPTALLDRCSEIIDPQTPECDQVLGHIQIGALDVTDDVIDLSKHSHIIDSLATPKFNIQSAGSDWYVSAGIGTGRIISPVVHTTSNLGDAFTIETMLRCVSLPADDCYLIYNPEFNLRINRDNLLFTANGTTIEYDHSSLTLGDFQNHHVAISRVGKGVDQTTMYIDGEPVTTGTYTGDVEIDDISGNPGYMIGGTPTDQNQATVLLLNDIRVTADHAVYMGKFVPVNKLSTLRRVVTEPVLDNIKLFLQTEGNDGSTTFDDISRSNHTVLSDQNIVTHSTDQSKWGDTSVKFNGTGGLIIPRINKVEDDFFDTQDTDFAYEMWVRAAVVDVDQTLLSLDKKQSLDSDASAYGHDAIRIDITDNNAIRCQIRSRGAGNPFESDGTFSGTGVIQTRDNVIVKDTWHHIAWSRHDGQFRVYVDGANVSTDQRNTSTGAASRWPYKPMRVDSGNNELNVILGGTRHDNFFTGYIDGFRYVKGEALYIECSYVVPDDSSPLDKVLPTVPDCEDVVSHIQTDGLYGISDFAGKENTLTLTGTDQSDAAFVLNGSMSIPLSGANNNPSLITKIDVENSDTPMDTSGSHAFYEMWMKPPDVKPDNNINNALQHYLRVFTMKDIISRDVVTVYVSDDKVCMYYGYMDQGVMKQFGPDIHNITAGSWFHLAIKRENMSYMVYINGDYSGVKSIAGLGTIPLTTQYTLGDDLVDRSGAIAYVDDLRISKTNVFPTNSIIYTQRLPRCDSAPGQCEDIPGGYDKLKICMSFESNSNEDMSRYGHAVIAESGGVNDGAQHDPSYQTYQENGEVLQFHSGYHGKHYHDTSVSNGLTITSSDHLIIGEEDFAIELHIPPVVVVPGGTNSKSTLYEQFSGAGDGVSIYFEQDSNDNIILCANLKSGTNNLTLKSHVPGATPNYDFTDTTRGEANQRIMLARADGVVRLYGYYNDNENQASVLKSDTFDHSISNSGDIKIGHGQHDNWSGIVDSIRVVVGSVISDCPYFSKKTCIKCEGFTGDVDAVKYICAVARSIGIQPVDIDYDKLYEVNKFVVTGKNEGWWSKIHALYLPIWQDPLANAINAKSPGVYNLDEDWEFNQHPGEWVHDNGPYTQLTNYNESNNGNGITTPFTNDQLSWSPDDCSVGVYLKDMPLDKNNYVMSTNNSTGINVDTRSRCNKSSGFTLMTTDSQRVKTYVNGTMTVNNAGVTQMQGVGENNKWVIGGTNWAGGGEMSSGINDIKIQGIYFGDGLTHVESKSISSSMVKIIQTFDYNDKNPSDVIDEDYLTNKALFAVLYRSGYTYTNPSWIRERDVMPGLKPSNMIHHETYQPLKNYYTTGNSWSDKIKALYLTMWKDSNVNRINFACPWLYDIESWNTRSPFWRLGGGTLLNPPAVNGTAILPLPRASYSANNITINDKENLITWNDDTGNGNHLTYDNSNHDDLATEPAGPQFNQSGGLNRDQKCVLFGYNGSRTPGQEHLYVTGRTGNNFKLIANSGIPQPATMYRHVFIVYRNITAVQDSSPVSFENDTTTFKQYNNTEGESITQSGFGVATINGYTGSYWKDTPAGDLTWTPDPKTIWPDGSNSTPAGTPLLPETRFGKKIVHYSMDKGTPPQEVSFCLGNLNSANPVGIHGEYYDVVVYDQPLTNEQVTAVHSYLASLHDISLHDDMLHNDYSASVEHGHGSFAYIPSNERSTGNISQGTITSFEAIDNSLVYSNDYISITPTSGGFGTVKYALDHCFDAPFSAAMGNNADIYWSINNADGWSGFNSKSGSYPGFVYLAREIGRVDLYTIDLNTPVDSKTVNVSTYPQSNPALFAENDIWNPGNIRDGSQDKYQAFFFTDDLTSSNQLSGFGGAINNITSNIPATVGTSCNTTYVSDPDAQAYICAVVNAGGLLPSEAANDLRVGAINDFVIRGKAQGWWNKIKAIYLPIWQCSEANKINAITPGVKPMLLDDTKLDHESGKYLRMLGTGSGLETSSEILIPYKPKDIYRAACEEHDPRMPTDYSHNITTYFKNFNVDSTSTGNNTLMWSFMYNELNNNSNNPQIYSNDPLNPDVSRDDLLMLEWPDRGTTFTSGPTNSKFQGPINTLIHDRDVAGELLSENLIGSSHNDLTFQQLEARSTTTTGLSGLKDTGGTGHRDYIIPQYYLNMPLGGSEDTCVSYIALGTGFNVDTEQPEFDDYQEAVKTLVAFADGKLNAHSYATIGSDVVKVHGIKSAGSRGSTVTLTSVKKATTAYNNTVPETITTTSTPLTSVWDDDRVWNYKLNDYQLELTSPDYTNKQTKTQIRPDGRHPAATNSQYAKATAFGYAIRRPDGGLEVDETLTGNDLYYQISNPQHQTFIRGLQSGAVRRSTYSRPGLPTNDHATNALTENRMLRFKIIHDQPEKGLFIAGGSSRTHDTSNLSSAGTSVADHSRYTNTALDLFNKYPSNNVDFILNEPLEIMMIDGSWSPVEFGASGSTGFYDSVGNQYYNNLNLTCFPLRSNIEYYNTRYRVAELADLDEGFLNDGNVFAGDETTAGGPEPKPDAGESVSLKAWMRVEMEDITTIDIGPTDTYDLLLTSTLSATDASNSHEWTSRFYFNSPGSTSPDLQYNLEVDTHSNIYVGGSYSDYAVVNYDLNQNEKYSLRLDCTGHDTDTTTPNISGFTQAFCMKIDQASGEVTNFRSTSGDCRAQCLGTAVDSQGNLYMVGSLAGKPEFIDNHGKFRSLNRGVNTTSLTNKFGFIAKSSMDHTLLDKFAVYRPLDYTWEWVNYIDAPGEAENQTRVVSDITIDGFDNVYVIGYHDSPSEIGRSGAASRTSDTLQFEPGYMWNDTHENTVYVSKYSPDGKCLWTKKSTIDTQIESTQKIITHNNKIYTMNNANNINFGNTSLSGVCIDSFDCDTGDHVMSKNINSSETITANDFNVSDNNIISIVGSYTGTVDSDTVTLISTPENAPTGTPAGYFAILPVNMMTGRAGSFSSTGNASTCSGTSTDYSIGHNTIMGVTTGNPQIKLGPITVNNTKPNNHGTYAFTLSHEL